MHVAIDIRPIDSASTSQHKVRGVGKYIALLKENLPRFDAENKYTFTSTPEEVSADLVHYPYFDPFFITLPLRIKRKTIVTVHDVIPIVHAQEFPVGLKGRLKWEVNKRLLKKANGIITDSNASRDDITNVTKIGSGKIFPVYLASDSVTGKDEAKDNVFKKYGIPDRYFLYVGDVTWNKNLPRIVEAVKETDITLVMVGKAIVDTAFDGKNPWNKDRIIVHKQTEGDARFVKTGFVPDQDLNVLYGNAIGLLMPSLDEGFGLPVLEAMGQGCPVITSRCGSLPEVGGSAVLYSDAFSSKDIARQMMSLANNAALRSEKIREGLKRSKEFSVKKMVEDTSAVYRQIYNETNS